MKPHDLINTARILLASNPRKPATVCCRRAVSSCYYALFHCLAQACADLLIGGAGSDRSTAAWRQTYRALEHGLAKDRCRDKKLMAKFPTHIEDFANAFVTLQEKRHKADYDPFDTFPKSSVEADIRLVEDVIAKFKLASAKDRRAFCAYVLLKNRLSY